MDEKQRMKEQIDYDTAKSWLKENGRLEVLPFNGESKFKMVFTKNKNITERTGEDVVRLTLQMYNEVKD